jgi:hypothetical protein
MKHVVPGRKGRKKKKINGEIHGEVITVENQLQKFHSSVHPDVVPILFSLDPGAVFYSLPLIQLIHIN